MIIKETLSGRKNTSPQNIYETGQLYAAGALKVACVGLQCVGFNNAMYRAILELAVKCAQNGKWRATPVANGASGLGTGSVWNTVANEAAGDRHGTIDMAHRNADGNENITPDDGGAKSRRQESGWPGLVP
jgi:hypothetical protein